MSKMTDLPPEWHQWIITNLQRNVPQSTLVADMVKNDFDGHFAVAVVAQLATTLMYLAQNSPSTLMENNGKVSGNVASPYTNFHYDQSRIPKENHFTIDGQLIHVVARTEKPDIVLLENFLTNEECAQLIETARPWLKPAKIEGIKPSGAKISEIRTSLECHLRREETETVARIEKRIATLIKKPTNFGEGLCITNTHVDDQSLWQTDYFSPEKQDYAKHLQRGGQRICSLIMYLNDIDEGGETYFPEIGFKCLPRKGSALYFSYHNKQEQLDRLTLYTGMRLNSGEKWTATKRIREREFFYKKDMH